MIFSSDRISLIILFVLSGILFIPQPGFCGDYTDNGDNTVTDNQTGLMWQKCARGQAPPDCAAPIDKAHPEYKKMRQSSTLETRGTRRANWTEALAYCENVIGNSGTFAGHSDWRLPNVIELESLSEDRRYNPAIDTAAFPNAVPSVYWSSTSYVPDAKVAWSVDLFWGRVYRDNKTVDYYIRCVRSNE